jgi:HlyD family secretion protein
MRRLIPATAVIVLVGVIIWAFLPRPVMVELAAVAPRTFQVTVEEEGEARIREVYTVSATIAGRLQRISLHAGDSVTEGETVVASIGPAAPVLLDSRSRAMAEASAAAAQAAVDLAQALLAQAEATLEFTTAEANRATALIDRGAITLRAHETAILEQRTARANVSSALANLEVRNQELESALAVLETGESADTGDCCVQIIAPVSGRVLRVLTESEQMVQPGTPILEVGNPGNLEIVVDLLSRDAVHVEEGAEASVVGWGGAPVAAQVARVEPSAVTKISALGIEEQRVKVLLGLTAPPEDGRALGHGFRVIVRITIWQGEDVLAIPVGALFRNGADWATYVDQEGRATLRRIALGERNAEFAQVLDGLAEGEQVILHPSDLIVEGVRVRPFPSDS